MLEGECYVPRNPIAEFPINRTTRLAKFTVVNLAARHAKYYKGGGISA